MFLLTLFRYFIQLFYYTSFFQGMQTRERAHCARSVFPFIKNKKQKKQRVVLNGKFSDWRNVSSGVPQGSVLGPILFLIYINDLDEDVKCKISKFADDIKIANRVISLSQQQELQNDLNTLGEWAVDSQMFFNVDKCKVLHIGN